MKEFKPSAGQWAVLLWILTLPAFIIGFGIFTYLTPDCEQRYMNEEITYNQFKECIYEENKK